MKLLASLLLLIAVCACTPPRQYRVTEGHTHTYYRITYNYDRTLDDEIRGEISRFYHSLNPFDSLSIVSAVNTNRNMEVDSIFIHAFRVAEEVSRQTDGMFDITCAPLINAWGFGFKNMGEVTPAMIDSLKTFVGYEKVRLEGNRVVKDDPRLLLNFSAVGDGCICDLIAARGLHHRLFPLFKGCFVESNPVPVKAAMACLGLMSPKVRLPLSEAAPATMELMNRIIEDLWKQA